MKAFLFICSFLLYLISTIVAQQAVNTTANFPPITQTSLVVLGTVQDAGSPHVGCVKDCCKNLFQQPDPKRKVVALGIVDPNNQKTYLFEATPDLPAQLKLLKSYAPFQSKETPDGIFLTHAHIGHYTGLMYLGKEAIHTNNVPVYAMPKMKTFLEENGPWSQLVQLNNISLTQLTNDEAHLLTSNVSVTPLTVPHRDEYSETVGFLIQGPHKKALFIPDIDKWGKWEQSIVTLINQVDYAFVDGTFFDGEEINHRAIADIPHPFIIESMQLFEKLTLESKHKVYFIHFNHTNPALNPGSPQAKQIIKAGFNIAQLNDIIEL